MFPLLADLALFMTRLLGAQRGGEAWERCSHSSVTPGPWMSAWNAISFVRRQEDRGAGGFSESYQVALHSFSPAAITLPAPGGWSQPCRSLGSGPE